AIALEMATGTSRALPNPKPTRPSPSPTTVSAVKPNWRPPFTTLATRLTAISFSSRPSEFSRSLRSEVAICLYRRCCGRGRLELWWVGSELQAGFARGVRQGRDAAVVAETRTIERHAGDARGQRLLGDGLADRGGRGLVLGVAGQPLAHGLLRGRGRGHDLLAARGDDLRVEVLARAV